MSTASDVVIVESAASDIDQVAELDTASHCDEDTHLQHSQSLHDHSLSLVQISVKLKFSHTRYRALSPELILVYRL